MSNDHQKYFCFDCSNHFGDIPAFGCPYCKSENYIETAQIVKPNQPEQEELLVGSML